jgi:heme exporter protein C
MGNVSRIFSIHVPIAQNALLVLLFAFCFAIASLWTGKRRWDAATAGAVEVGVVLTALLLATGMLFARPTWGVWWTWDVRLTTSLVGLILFATVLALRSFVEDEPRRATWTAVTTIIAFVDVPLIYFCVRWWRSLHQVQSSPETVDSMMVLPYRINAFGVLFLAIFLIALRSRLETRRLEGEEVAQPPRLASTATA